MKEISLTYGEVALVDDSDFEWLNQWKWYTHFAGNRRYARRSISKNTSSAMHRDLMGLSNPKDIVDHIDGNGLNNQRHNIRLATYGQNSQNKHRSKSNTSGFRGVSWHFGAAKWQSSIRKNRKTIYLGCFIDIEDAARAYNVKARELFGEHAWVNPISTNEVQVDA